MSLVQTTPPNTDANVDAPMHRPICQLLQRHFQTLRNQHMRDMFADDPHRFERFSLKLGDLLLDYSKNRITSETMQLLVKLAEEADVAGWRDKMFNGVKINNTENRACCMWHYVIEVNVQYGLMA